MVDPLKEIVASPRDGTSQAGRVLAALNPGYVSVDERTLEDLLEFARKYGEGLEYHGENGEIGNWSGFIPARLSSAEIAAFIREPEKFDPERHPELFRPHLVLFLVFLKLFQKVQGELNTLTRRHLEFYYRRVLGMANKKAVPDRVNVIFELAAGEEEVLVPRGTLLEAGVDSLGQDRVYATDREIVVNRVRIEKVSSLFFDRRRTGEGEEDWRNLYAAEDAAASGARGASGEQWATFGLARPSSRSTAAPRPLLGWAISSPLLLLTEGRRTINLTLGFADPGVEPSKINEILRFLQFEVSTPRGWVEIQPDEAAPSSASGPTTNGIRFKLSVPTKFDPITTLPVELADIDSPWPILRLMLRSRWSLAERQHVTRYSELRNLFVVSAHVNVEVEGITALELENDETVLDAKKPFEPFGSEPKVGSRLMIGHPEIATKKVDSLTINFKWMGAPPDIQEHYANYNLPSGSEFTAKVALFDRAVERGLFDGNVSLFPNDSSAKQSITLTAGPTAAGTEMIPAGELGEDLSTWRCYLQWELNTPDFQHAAYPAIASFQALRLAAAFGAQKPPKSTDISTYQVNPPYTPKLKYLSLDYTSSLEIRLGTRPIDGRVARIFHIHPFGYCGIEVERLPAGLPFLPRYDDDGELYIGLRDILPPQTVSILFQMAEGSADPDLAPHPVRWSYLSGDTWISLDGGVLLDTTRGFINSGIVEIALEPAMPSTRLRGGLYWIRAAIARNTASVCDTIALHTQATSAILVDRDNASDHFRHALPAETITKLATAQPEIARVYQPYPSFGGRMMEGNGMWATRVSERLRHRQRALSTWDYERLVLERFPEIYKAKCISTSAAEPGKLEIIVIPDIRNMLPFDPFEPKAPAKLLADIEAYLHARTPSFVSVKARNPHYVAVRVRLAVRFTSDGNDGYYTRRLNEDLNRFLSPWAYEEGADIVIAGKIYANSIADFVDRRPYVDYVAGITLFSSEDGEHFRLVLFDPDAEYFVGTGPPETGRPDVVLVAARTHAIVVLHDKAYDAESNTGIGFMKIDLDFVVQPDPSSPDGRQP